MFVTVATAGQTVVLPTESVHNNEENKVMNEPTVCI